MLFKRRADGPGLSVVAVFHNMRREARRTLHSLSATYQALPAGAAYEVLVIDNGSGTPLREENVRSFGPEFRHLRLDSASPSPCAAINTWIGAARFENVIVLIDGARILSPGILQLMSTALRAFPHPFVYTLGMHIGHKPQNYLVAEGWNQDSEDRLLAEVDWQRNGYALFTVSSVALSSRQGFFSPLSESNCFCARRDDLLRIGMYNTGFTSPGGGLCNLDIFNRFNDADWIQPVLLLGEATFHQFHGGVATNVPMDRHPWDAMAEEYLHVVGKPYENRFRPPVYLGTVRPECRSLYLAPPPDGAAVG